MDRKTAKKIHAFSQLPPRTHNSRVWGELPIPQELPEQRFYRDKMGVLPGTLRDATGVTAVCDYYTKRSNFEKRLLLAERANDWRTAKKLRAFLNRLEEIKSQKFPGLGIIYEAVPPEMCFEERAYVKQPNEYSRAIKRVKDKIQTMEEKAHLAKKHGISIYNNAWARKVTEFNLREVRSALTKKGYKFHSYSGTLDDKYSKMEKTWRFYNASENDEIALSMLQDNSWVFDIFHNKMRTPHLIMNQSRIGQKSQGVPISMKGETFMGIYSPAEARTYKENWRRAMKWIYSI